MKTLFAAAVAALIATGATAGTVDRTNMGVEGGAFVYAVTVNTGSSLVYLTQDKYLKGREALTDRQVMIVDIDITDPEAVAAFAAETFGGEFDIVLKPNDKVLPGPDGILGTADDIHVERKPTW